MLKDGYRPVLEGLALGLFIGLAGRAIVLAYLETGVTSPRGIWRDLAVGVDEES